MKPKANFERNFFLFTLKDRGIYWTFLPIYMIFLLYKNYYSNNFYLVELKLEFSSLTLESIIQKDLDHL